MLPETFPITVRLAKLAILAKVTALFAIVAAAVTFALPLKLTVHEMSPVAVILLAVASVVAVSALPVKGPVKPVAVSIPVPAL